MTAAERRARHQRLIDEMFNAKAPGRRTPRGLTRLAARAGVAG